MLEAARGWLTPGVLFVLVNLVVAAIAVASRLMPQAPEDVAAEERRRGGLMRAPSLAINRLRSTFSFSRLGLAGDQTPLFHGAVEAPAPEDEAGEQRGRLLRAPSSAVDRLRSMFSFSRLGLAADHDASSLFDGAVGAQEQPFPKTPVTGGTEAPEPKGEAEATQPDAAAGDKLRRPRATRMRRAATEEEPALARVAGVGRRGEEPAAVEVDARADDFIRRFREQLRVQRLDSILRYRDTLRRTGTA